MCALKSWMNLWRWSVAAGLVLCAGTLFAQGAQTLASVASADALGDSLLKMYSLDELLSYKRFYESERDRMEAERIRLRKKGIQDLEAFIRNHPESQVLDKVLFRLAELYYEEAEDAYARAQEAYSQQLELYDEGKIDQQPEEPKRDYSRSLGLYRYIIDTYPASQLIDDAYYNIAFLTEQLGRREEALALYEKFVENFPDSRYMPEVLMRQAEYYFNPPVNNLEKAIEIYQRILQYTDSRRYDEALYRLGWSYYRLNDYPRAISYFTMLADDIEAARKYDPKFKITNPSFREESIEYIGISFLDYSGVDGAARFLERIGGREYGLDILKKMGDSYLEVKEEYDRAIHAYQTLLKLYPFAEEAPIIEAKIAEAYRRKEDEQNTYLTRKTIFQKYRPGTEWWEKVTDPEARERALQLAELAMRSNINLLLDAAQERGDNNLYWQAVEDSREYLRFFKEDTNAARIHWNMALILDTRLRRLDQALNEYIAISNEYWDTRFQKDAAKNAIALAQEMIAADTIRSAEVMPLSLAEMREKAKADSAELRKSLNLQPLPLTPGELKLAEAIDNYIKLFPFDNETPERLSQAGSVYYNKNHFIEALKYFKTLLKHFPDHPLAEYAQFLVMESYFGKLDYRSVEIVARRLRSSSRNPEYAAKANQRLAEAIFLQAESLADSAEHFKAAEEYRRVADEVPDAEFADLALFNAGLEFDRAREYRRAVEMYSRLADSYPGSDYYLASLNNMALDYGELQDFQNAAITFERLAEEEPDSAKSETHLYNASVFYVKAEDWERAIRVNRKFVERFPDSPDADDLFYDIATYYLKLGDLDRANEIYGEYARKFPDSPRVVETYYRRGEYFESQGQMDLARTEYNLAIDKSRAFKEQGKDANDFFAAEALFRLTELDLQDYLAIEFRLPLETLARNKERKKALLKKLVDNYAKVAAYGTVRLYESTYKIGLVYENFAETWAHQDIPEAQEERRIVAQKEINQTATELYERALQAYKHSREVLTRLANQYQLTMPAADTAAGLQTGRKVEQADTTLKVARRWIERSEEKISEVIYDIAEINFVSVTQLLNAPTPPGLDELTALEFRNQLLGKFVQPLVQEIVQAHARNLKESEELGLDNQWVEQSRSKILSTGNIIPKEYAQLAWQALEGYKKRIPTYQKTLTEDDVLAMNIADEMANFIEFSRAFGKATLAGYQNSIDRAIELEIQSYVYQPTMEELFRFTDRLAAQIDSLARVASTLRKEYEEKSRQTGEAVYEDGLFTFEDNYFSLIEARKDILAMGFNLAQKYEVHNEQTENIVLNLVRSDPDQYAGLLGLQIHDWYVATDSSWRVWDKELPEWTESEFDDSGWPKATIIDSSLAFAGYGARKIWMTRLPAGLTVPDSQFNAAVTAIVDTLGADSTANVLLGKAAVSPDSVSTGVTSVAERVPSTVYFTKMVDVAGLPVQAQIQILADDYYRLFVNGELISEGQRDSTNARPGVHDFSDFLQSGRNRIGLMVVDTDRSGGALEALVFLRSLPGWQQRKTEIEQLKKKQRENLLFDKGIVPPKH